MLFNLFKINFFIYFRYSLKSHSDDAGSIAAIIVCIIIVFALIIVCGVACTKCKQNSVTVYHDHTPTVITSARPAIYSVPTPMIAPIPYIQPAPSYYNSGYTTSHVDTGFASTSFRPSDNNYSSGNDYTHTDTGFSSTSFR